MPSSASIPQPPNPHSRPRHNAAASTHLHPSHPPRPPKPPPKPPRQFPATATHAATPTHQLVLAGEAGRREVLVEGVHLEAGEGRVVVLSPLPGRAKGVVEALLRCMRASMRAAAQARQFPGLVCSLPRSRRRLAHFACEPTHTRRSTLLVTRAKPYPHRFAAHPSARL